MLFCTSGGSKRAPFRIPFFAHFERYVGTLLGPSVSGLASPPESLFFLVFVVLALG